VGDNYTDLESARRAGVRSIFVTYGYGEPGNEQPTLTCRSFGDWTSSEFQLASGQSHIELIWLRTRPTMSSSMDDRSSGYPLVPNDASSQDARTSSLRNREIWE